MFVKQFHFWMRHVVLTVERRYFSKNNIGNIDFQTFSNPFMTLKPNEFHFASFISKSCHQTFFGFAKFNGFDVDDFTNDLNFRRIIIEFINFIITSSINIAIGIKINQIFITMNAQFFTQKLATLRTNAF